MTETLGDYELLEHLASGGMADVWLADRVSAGGFRKRVVIKRIKSDHSDDPDFETMFLDEARIALHLSHPNIVQTFDLGESDAGEWYVAMELVDGPSLESIIDQQAALERPMDTAVACRIATELLAALEYAHDFVDPDGTHLQIVHRDVTPSNVLLTSAGVVKLADFGVAKAVGRQTETQTGAVKGKFGYLAPEQVQNGEVDGRTDLFAVGVVMYEALTNTEPFGDGLQGVHVLLQGEYEPLAERRPDLPPEIVEIVERAMEHDPADRWQSAKQMRTALEDACRELGLIATLSDVEHTAHGLGNAATRAMERPAGLAETDATEPEQPEQRSSRGPAFLLGLLVGILFLLAGTSVAFFTLGDDDTEQATADAPNLTDTPTTSPDEDASGAGGRESHEEEPAAATPRPQHAPRKDGKAAEEKHREDKKRAEEKRREDKKRAEEKRREDEERAEEEQQTEEPDKLRKKKKKKKPGKGRGRGKGRGKGLKKFD